MRSIVYWMLALAGVALSASAAQTWIVRVEEPTGIERRDRELARAPLSRFGGAQSGFRVVDSQGRELPSQVDGQNLLFPVTLIGGQMAEYRVTCCDASTPVIQPAVTARRLPSGRVELANSRLRVLIEASTGRIVEAYNLSAGPQRVLNLVETTPDDKDKNDIQSEARLPSGPPSPVKGPNNGWSDLGPAGPVTAVLAAPLLARITGDGWSMEIEADSPRLLWRGRRGFHFAGVSALPHLPFDRFVHAGEYDWPTGPGSGEPPDHAIAARDWKQAPGGGFVYYAQAENYGALAMAALDESIEWTGVGTFRFEGRGAGDRSELAILFSRWRGNDTVLEARADARRAKAPVLVRVEAPRETAAVITQPLHSHPPQSVHKDAALPPAWRPSLVPLDGDWELAWGEKGAGPQSEWRTVKVPGSAHLQWLPPAEIYSPSAAWVSRKEWWYRKRFNVPADFRPEHSRLEFDATDYYAEAFLDGRRLGRHEGYIDPYAYDVTGLVKPGSSHELLVRVWTPVHYYWKHRPYTVKGSYGGVDQKPDDITALGVTRSVRLSSLRRCANLRSGHLHFAGIRVARRVGTRSRSRWPDSRTVMGGRARAGHLPGAGHSRHRARFLEPARDPRRRAPAVVDLGRRNAPPLLARCTPEECRWRGHRRPPPPCGLERNQASGLAVLSQRQAPLSSRNQHLRQSLAQRNDPRKVCRRPRPHRAR